MNTGMVAVNKQTVLVTPTGLASFARQWPCSGIPCDGQTCVMFSFCAHGDLIDVEWLRNGHTIEEPESVDGAAMVALSQDAQRKAVSHAS